MSEQGLNEYVEADLDIGAEATATFQFGGPVLIESWGYVLDDEALDDSDAVLTMNHLEADGSALDPTGAAEGGTITCDVIAVLTGKFKRLTSRMYVLPAELLTVVAVNNTATTGQARCFVNYRPMPMQDGNIRLDSHGNADTSVPGSEQRTSFLAGLTEQT